MWAGNSAAWDLFGPGPLDAGVHDSAGGLITPPRLRLSPRALALRDALLRDHLTALDPDDPGGPSPWSDGQRAQFNARVARFCALLQDELGQDVLIVNEQTPG